MRRSPASALGGAENRASVAGYDKPGEYSAGPDPQVLGEIAKNSRDAFRLVRTAGDAFELQLVMPDGRGQLRPRQRFAFGAKHATKILNLLDALLPPGAGRETAK